MQETLSQLSELNNMFIAESSRTAQRLSEDEPAVAVDGGKESGKDGFGLLADSMSGASKSK
jgi:hypothetical protein